jgi:hypothetical protein
VNNKLERIWKEAIVVLFKVISHNLPGDLRKITKPISHNSGSPGRVLKPVPLEWDDLFIQNKS